MYDPNVDRLLNLAAGCQEVIRQRVEDLAHLQEELQGLDGRTCSGREWWRDQDHPTKTAKLYIARRPAAGLRGKRPGQDQGSAGGYCPREETARVGEATGGGPTGPGFLRLPSAILLRSAGLHGGRGWPGLCTQDHPSPRGCGDGNADQVGGSCHH